MKKIVGLVLCLALLFNGCATLSKIFCEPEKDIVQMATEYKNKVDTLYNKAVEMKALPDFTNEMTLALTAFDAAVPVLQDIIDGICKNDVDLNKAIADVTGAILILQKNGIVRN